MDSSSSPPRLTCCPLPPILRTSLSSAWPWLGFASLLTPPLSQLLPLLLTSAAPSSHKRHKRESAATGVWRVQPRMGGSARPNATGWLVAYTYYIYAPSLDLPALLLPPSLLPVSICVCECLCLCVCVCVCMYALLPRPLCGGPHSLEPVCPSAWPTASHTPPQARNCSISKTNPTTTQRNKTKLPTKTKPEQRNGLTCHLPINQPSIMTATPGPPREEVIKLINARIKNGNEGRGEVLGEVDGNEMD